MEIKNTKATIAVVKLEPSNGKHLKNVKNGEMFEGAIFLGKYDYAENYEEVSEDEYKAYLKKQQEQPELPPEEHNDIMESVQSARP